MKEDYESVKLEVIALEAANVIMTSRDDNEPEDDPID